MKVHTRSKFLSLRVKIVISFLLIILFSSSIIGSYSYFNAKSNIEKAVGDSALSIIESIVNIIDGDKFDNLKTKEDMQSQYYTELQARLSTVKQETGLKYLYTMRKTEDGRYIYVVDGTSMQDEGFSSLGDEEKDIDTILKEAFDGKTGYGFNSDDWGDFISAFIPLKDKSGNIVGILGADFDASKVLNQLSKFRTNIIIIIASVIILALLIGIFLSYFLVRSLNKLRAQAELLKEGDLTVRLNRVSADEVGALTQVFIDMVKNILSIIKDIKINTKNVATEIEELHNSISNTSRATEEIAQVINEIATGTVDQANSVSEVSSSMDKVFIQARKSAEQADLIIGISSHAADMATQAKDIFKASIEKVINVNETVENTAEIILKLGEKSKEISSISDTISQITKQTKLLSLNAAIEAARAGEHGKGFAVVADQVKILSEQSSGASKHINEIANGMQDEINIAINVIQSGVLQANEGVSTVTMVDTFLEGLQDSSKDSNARVKHIMDSIALIEEASRKAVDKVNELADISRSFSAGSQQAAAATEEQNAVIHQIMENIKNVKDMTSYLNNVTNKFRVE